jgi:hypothetical protein
MLLRWLGAMSNEDVSFLLSHNAACLEKEWERNHPRKERMTVTNVVKPCEECLKREQAARQLELAKENKQCKFVDDFKRYGVLTVVLDGEEQKFTYKSCPN